MVFEPVHVFIIDDDIIYNSSTWDEGTLKWINDIIHSGLKSVGNILSYNLVTYIAEADRLKFLDGRRVFDFVYKDKDRLILIIKGGSMVKNIQNSSSNLITNSVPSTLEEKGSIAIKTRSLGGVHIK